MELKGEGGGGGEVSWEGKPNLEECCILNGWNIHAQTQLDFERH
jgi:hypothetical protein